MFKDEFKELRIKNKYTQEELAKRLGVGKSTISMYENGNRVPDLEMLETIADFFNVDMNRLTSSSAEKPPKTIEEQLEGFEFALYTGAKGLTEDKKKAVLNYIKFLQQEEE